MGNFIPRSVRPDEEASQESSRSSSPQSSVSDYSFYVVSEPEVDKSSMGTTSSAEKRYERISQNQHEETRERCPKKEKTESSWSIIGIFTKFNIFSASKMSEELSKLRKENVNLEETVMSQEIMLKDKEDIINGKQMEIQNLIKEKEGYLNRLSTMAGYKLKNNNPGITDLSDDNRPSKLAEKFSELYDNEWTEAYEALFDDNSLVCIEGQDKEALVINQLVQLLQNVYVKCQEVAARQRGSLTLLCLRPMGSSVKAETDFVVVDSDTCLKDEYLDKKVSDFQKETAQYSIQGIQEMIQNNNDIKSQYESCIKYCPKYTRKCVELCWYMSIQDPPIFMDFSAAKSGANYDATNWREYTIKGTEVDFMVWPALFLHKDGPLLSKGVLQPKDVITVTSEAQRDVETPSGILINVDN